MTFYTYSVVKYSVVKGKYKIIGEALKRLNKKKIQETRVHFYITFCTYSVLN